MVSVFAEANVIAACGFSLLAGSIVFARRARNASVRNYMTLVSIVLGTFALCGVCLYVALFIWPPIELAAARRGWIEDRRFDTARWVGAETAAAGLDVRQDMIDHLLASRDHLAGMTKEQVVALLGSPMPPSADQAWPASDSNDRFAYALGEGFLSTAWLLIDFDPDGCVTASTVEWQGFD